MLLASGFSLGGDEGGKYALVLPQHMLLPLSFYASEGK